MIGKSGNLRLWVLLSLVASILIAAIAVFLMGIKSEGPAEPAPPVSRPEVVIPPASVVDFLAHDIGDVLMACALPVSKPVVSEDSVAVFFRYPYGISASWVAKTALEVLDVYGLEGKAAIDGAKAKVSIEIDAGMNEATRLMLTGDREMVKGVVALIIDDFGYNMSVEAVALLELDVTLGVSVIPGHEFSRTTAEQAQMRGKEVLLHLPMEPYDYAGGEEKYIIMVGMEASDVRKRFREALANVPGVVGVNNHQGSRATSDSILMKTVLDEVQRYDLYFVDSFTHSGSVAFREARKLSIPSERRSVFLDDAEDYMTVSGRMQVLRRIAEKNGYAIGIGHANKETLSALEREIPLMKQEGYIFVNPSQLVR